MRIQNDGNVGIGTTAPAMTLDVYKSVTGDWLSRIHNTATSGNSSGLLVRMDEAGSSGFAFATLVNGNYKLDYSIYLNLLFYGIYGMVFT